MTLKTLLRRTLRVILIPLTLFLTLIFLLGSFVPGFLPVGDWFIETTWRVLLVGLVVFLGVIWPKGLGKKWMVRMKTLFLVGVGAFFVLLGLVGFTLGLPVGVAVVLVAGLLLLQGFGMIVWALYQVRASRS